MEQVENRMLVAADIKSTRPLAVSILIVLKLIATAIRVPVLISAMILGTQGPALGTLGSMLNLVSSFVVGFGLYGLSKMERWACDLLLVMGVIDLTQSFFTGSTPVMYLIFCLAEFLILLVFREKMKN